MTLQAKIRQDLKAAMKAQDLEKKAALRVVIGEIGRLPTKDPSDQEVLQVLKKLIKSEREVLQRQGGRGSSAYLETLEGYLPAMASEAEIADWIRSNIDLRSYTNKMQAMGEIMRHFGGSADGRMVKSVLEGFDG